MNTAQEIFDYAKDVLSDAFNPALGRVIEGIAATGKRTSHGETRNPQGVIYRLPVPLLVNHDRTYPVGWVKRVTTGATVRFMACVANRRLPYADDVWRQLKSGDINCVSIGASGQEWDYSVCRRFDIVKWSLNELSLVSEGADSDAKIHVVKEVERPDTIRLDGSSRRETVFRDLRHIYRDTLPREVSRPGVRLASP